MQFPLPADLTDQELGDYWTWADGIYYWAEYRLHDWSAVAWAYAVRELVADWAAHQDIDDEDLNASRRAYSEWLYRLIERAAEESVNVTPDELAELVAYIADDLT